MLSRPLCFIACSCEVLGFSLGTVVYKSSGSPFQNGSILIGMRRVKEERVHCHNSDTGRRSLKQARCQEIRIPFEVYTFSLWEEPIILTMTKDCC